MRVKLQLVICDDQGQHVTITDVITLNKDHQRIEQLGLTLADAKHLLSTLQRHLLHRQVDAFLGSCSMCPDCGTPLKTKAYTSRSFRTLFGTFKLESPRLEHCVCVPRKTSSFRPLLDLLTESVAPELLYIEAKWSSLVSYGMSLEALKDSCPSISRSMSKRFAMTRSRCPAYRGRTWRGRPDLYRRRWGGLGWLTPAGWRLQGGH